MSGRMRVREVCWNKTEKTCLEWERKCEVKVKSQLSVKAGVRERVCWGKVLGRRNV